MAKIVVGYPPIYEEIVSAIGTPPPTAVYTWEDSIFVPSGVPLSDDLIAHEQAHMMQQRLSNGAPNWWGRYLRDPEFRVQEELSAYRAQYKFYCLTNRDRNARARFRTQLAGCMAGPMYGRPIRFNEAYAEIGRG